MSRHWQQHITDWHRNLYGGFDRAPAIGADEHLVASAIGPEPLVEMGLTPYQMQAVALEKFPEHRWLAKLGRSMKPFCMGRPGSMKSSVMPLRRPTRPAPAR